MSSRRSSGSLETAVLEVLWKSDHPITPGEVLDALGDGLAYTTVMTVLGRLWQKGLVGRTRVGRAFAYTATVSAADLSAEQMHRALELSNDALATMSQFVGGLDPEQQARLRTLLEQSQQ